MSVQAEVSIIDWQEIPYNLEWGLLVLGDFGDQVEKTEEKVLNVLGWKLAVDEIWNIYNHLWDFEKSVEDFIFNYFINPTSNAIIFEESVQVFLLQLLWEAPKGDLLDLSFVRKVMESEISSHCNTSKYRELLVILFKRVIKELQTVVRSLWMDGSMEIISRIYYPMFWMSPGLFTQHLSIQDQFYLTSLCQNSNEAVEAGIYRYLVWEIEYDICILNTDKWIKNFFDFVKSKSDSEMIWMLQLLVDIDSSARYSWSNSVSWKLLYVLRQMLKDKNNPLISFLLNSTIEELSNNIDLITSDSSNIYNSNENVLERKELQIDVGNYWKRDIPNLNKWVLLKSTHSIFQIARDSYVAYDWFHKPIAFSNIDMSEFTYYDEMETRKDLWNLEGISWNLIKNLHWMNAKRYFEKEFPISLLEISLKSQIQLLNFLYNKSDNEVERIKDILQCNEENKYAILESFLALSCDENISSTILNIAESDIESDKKKHIFDKYNTLVNTINLEVEELSESMEGIDADTIFAQTIIKLNLVLKKINVLIVWEVDVLEIQKILDETQKDIIKSWLIFKSIKDKELHSLDDLEQVWITCRRTKLSESSEGDKEKVLWDLLTLYNDNYDVNTQWEFLSEIEEWLEQMMKENREVEFYMFYVDWEPILSSYFKELDDWSKYAWWFNAKSSFQEYNFGFWAFEKMIEEQEGNDISFTVTKSIQWEENRRHKMLVRMYQKAWFTLSWKWSNKTSAYSTMSNRKKEAV